MSKVDHETAFPDKQVTLCTRVECDDCCMEMIATDGYNLYTETRDFECVECGKTVTVNTPTSGDVT